MLLTNILNGHPFFFVDSEAVAVPYTPVSQPEDVIHNKIEYFPARVSSRMCFCCTHTNTCKGLTVVAQSV